MTANQRHRRRAIRWAFFITGLIFYAVLFLGPAIGGLIPNNPQTFNRCEHRGKDSPCPQNNNWRSCQPKK